MTGDSLGERIKARRDARRRDIAELEAKLAHHEKVIVALHARIDKLETPAPRKNK